MRNELSKKRYEVNKLTKTNDSLREIIELQDKEITELRKKNKFISKNLISRFEGRGKKHLVTGIESELFSGAFKIKSK